MIYRSSIAFSYIIFLILLVFCCTQGILAAQRDTQLVRGRSGQDLEQALTSDQSPEERAQAAEALAEDSSAETVATLRSALKTETNPRVVDAIVKSLTRLEALPEDPDQCLQMANLGWDVSVVKAPFRCWRKTAGKKQLIEEATTSGNMAVRTLALTALTGKDRPRTPFGPARRKIPEFEKSLRDKLLSSATEILEHDISVTPDQSLISTETAWLAKEALWDISGHQMAVALEYADRIGPLHYGYYSTGRYGVSYHLSNKDENAYSAVRRPQQWLAAGLLAILFALLLTVRELRPLCLSMLGASAFWVVWVLFETGLNVLPPPPLWYLTVSALAFLVSGLVSGIFGSMDTGKWSMLFMSPLVAGIAASVICYYTRAWELYPVDSGSWATLFDPIGCALMAIPTAFILSLLLLLVRSRFNSFLQAVGR